MIKIRQATPETNSSSTHTLTFVGDKEREKNDSGKFVVDYDGDFIPIETIEADFENWKHSESESVNLTIKSYADRYGRDLKSYTLEENMFWAFLKDSDYYLNLDEWINHSQECLNLEYKKSSYTTKSGEVIECICLYGFEQNGFF